MGQSASKTLSKAAEKVAKKAMDQRPPIPKRDPTITSTPPPPQPPSSPQPSAANPANFLRGSGIATQDVRDVGQEMYLQHVQNMSKQHHQQQQY